MVTIITPTGDRSEVFELCRRWMSSQTRQPDQWIVVDDGRVPVSEDLREGLEYIRRKPKIKEGFTLLTNLKTAIPFIKGDKILIVEDDDWYGPTYVETMCSLLSKYDLVGECRARYYHVPSMRYRRINNLQHASLCQTGFNRSLLSTFEKCLDGDSYVDARFWGIVKGHLFSDTDDKLHLHCSMKGLKGRQGIGTGHNAESKYYYPDSCLKYLIRWVGEENARLYMNHVGQSFGSAVLIGVPRNSREYFSLPKPVDPPKSLEGPKSGSGITVITCTGDRQQSFDLLRKWVGNQSLKPTQWIVVDDGKVPLEDTNGFEYHRREPTKEDFPHTLCQNLSIALDHVANEKVIIMEDDDWYHPTYIDYMSNLLDRADLVGFQNLLFYYPSIGKYLKRGSAKQPALSQTAFKRSIIPIIKGICSKATNEWGLSGKGLIDVFLWSDPLTKAGAATYIRLTTSLKVQDGKILVKGTEVPPPFPPALLKRAERRNGAEFFTKNVPIKASKLLVLTDSYLTVGMKGQPGRKGLTTHHQADKQQYKEDVGHNLLKSILKSDSKFYIKEDS